MVDEHVWQEGERSTALYPLMVRSAPFARVSNHAGPPC